MEEHLSAFAERAKTILGEAAISLDARTRESASRDYAWLSPILPPASEQPIADLVAYPKNTDELASLVSLAYEFEIPITPRGKGTGNYGQSIPLKKGLVLDTSKMDRILEIGDGYLRAECGASFSKLESAARNSGQELSIFPSTTNSFLGGFLSGGSGGTGSTIHGFAWDGFVQQLKVVPCREDCSPFEVDAPQTLDHLHGYGTTGILAEATIKLTPKTEWTALFASFPAESWTQASELGFRMMKAAHPARLVSVDQPSFLKFFPEHPGIKKDRISFRAIIDPQMLDTYKSWIDEHGGTFELTDDKACLLLTFLSYNHVSLRAKQSDPGICHLQIGGEPVVSHIDEICSFLPESTVHLDGMKVGGNLAYGGILISRFIDKATLYEAMDKLRAIGCVVVDPHHWYLGSGHFPKLSDLQRVAPQVDPKGLLNPGRFR